MKATELRIGNYINDEAVVNGIIKGTIYVNPTRKIISKGIAFSYRYSQIKPIPLTEQWLRDFDWYEEKKYWYDKDKECRIHFLKSKDKILSIVLDRHYIEFADEEKLTTKWVFIKEFQYVHQLQNLYFALTGKELKNKNHD